MTRWPVLVALAAVGCGAGDRSLGDTHEPAPLFIAVALDSLRTAPVRAVVAPDISFRGYVEPDPRHAAAILAPAIGVVVSVQPDRPVVRGAAVLQFRGADDAELTFLKAPTDGAWRPRRLPQQFVWAGDTLGIVRGQDYWLAVGSVPDYASAVIHAGDSATVRFDGTAAVRAGRVEEVVRAGIVRRYSAEVAVEFRAAGYLTGNAAPGAVTVTVHPRDARDSVIAVPAEAVAHLPGAAVFLPAGDRRFEVRWILEEPASSNVIIVRQGVAPNTQVVTGALGPLVAAARDSLEARRRARRLP